MPSYMVESYVGISAGSVDDARERAQRAAELGDRVVYVRTTYLPEDETILHVFEAPSAAVLRQAGQLAELDFERIVEAVEGASR